MQRLESAASDNHWDAFETGCFDCFANFQLFLQMQTMITSENIVPREMINVNELLVDRSTEKQNFNKKSNNCRSRC